MLAFLAVRGILLLHMQNEIGTPGYNFLIPSWLFLFIGTGALWLSQLVVSAYSDSNNPANKSPGFWFAVRVVLVTGMSLCFIAGIVRFIKWVW